MVMMLMPTTTTLTTDAGVCYVELHGFGLGQLGEGEPPPADWYKAVALNGVKYMNVTRGNAAQGPQGPGIFTYIVDPVNCSASDLQWFDTHNDDTASPDLIDYMQSLANGRLSYGLILLPL